MNDWRQLYMQSVQVYHSIGHCECVTSIVSYIRFYSTLVNLQLLTQGMTTVRARIRYVNVFFFSLNVFCLPFRSKFQLLGRIHGTSSKGLTHHIQISFHFPPQIDFTRDITNWVLSKEVDICRNFLNYTVDVEKRKLIVTVCMF